MAKITDLGITIRPSSMPPRESAGFGYHAIYDRGMECEENTGSDTCAANDITCAPDDGGDEGGDSQGGKPKPHKYYAFNPELISQFKQQLDSHLGT